MDYSLITNNLLIIFIMIAVGFASGKAKLVSDRAASDFTSFVLNVSLPCTALVSMAREFDQSLWHDSVIGFGLGAVMFSSLLVLWYFVSGKLKVPRHRRGVWIISGSCGNLGFIGLPLLLAIFGTDGVFISNIFNLPFMIMQYTLCVRMFCKFSGSDQSSEVNWKKILLSNTNIAMAVGLFLFFTQIPLPATIQTVAQNFSNVTTPLSMFLIGLNISKGNIGEIFKDRDVITCCIARLVAVPLMTALVLHFLPLSDLLKGVILLVSAMPAPSLGMIFSEQYGGDAKMASQLIFLTTLCCMVTIPVVMMLL